MALDFEWNGSRWESKKVRRKEAWHEHKGVAYYDRDRMRKPLLPIAHPASFEGWSTPLSPWIDRNWQSPDYSSVPRADASPADDLDDLPIAQSADYRLERCHVETVCERGECGHGKWVTVRRPVTYRWELTFADGAQFRFVSRAMAESALSELLKIRKAKHPQPRFAKPSPENEAVFFTDRKLQRLAPDGLPLDQPLDANSIDPQVHRGAA
jgi:hypothetical protein